MKIGLIADIHSNIYGLRNVLKKLKDVDIIFCAGDIIGYYTFVNEVIDKIRENNIRCILGNHDAYLLGLIACPNNGIINNSIEYSKKVITKRNLDYLKDIGKPFFETEIDGLKIKIYHGSPWNQFEEYIYPDYEHFIKFKDMKADMIVLGHTHRSFVKKTNDTLVINPGSCGQPRGDEKKASCAIFDTVSREVTVIKVEYDVDKVCEGIRKNSLNKELIDMLRQ